MKNKQGICRVFVLALITSCFTRISSNNTEYSGLVGCKVDDEVCQDDELCIDDCFFGSCQTLEYYKTYGEYCYDLTYKQLLTIREVVAELVEAQVPWTDLRFQCIIGNMLISYRHHQPVDESFCDGIDSTREDVEQEIAAAAERLLQKYVEDYNLYEEEQEPQSSLILSALQSPRSFPSESYIPFDSNSEEDEASLSAYPYSRIDSSIDLQQFPDPLLSETDLSRSALEPYLEEKEDYSPSDFSNQGSYYIPVNKKDEYVQVHKYLKSHKRNFSPSYENAYDFYDIENRDDDFDQDFYGPPTEEQLRQQLLKEEYPDDYFNDEELLDQLTPEDIVELYHYLTGKTLKITADEEALQSDFPVLEDVEEKEAKLGVHGAERKPIAEEMMFEDEEKEIDVMSPDDAMLLDDVLSERKSVDDLSTDEVQKLSGYVENIIEHILEGERGSTEDEQEVNVHNTDADTTGNEEKQEVLDQKNSLNEAQSEKRDEIQLESKRADAKDTSFYGTQRPIPTAANKYALVDKNRLWMETEETNLKRDEVIDLLEAIENILQAPKLLTQENNQLRIGTNNIIVSLDPENPSQYNASDVARVAVEYRKELANQSKVWITNAGFGEGDNRVSIKDIEHTSPKYFVLTFVLCGAVAGIVLAVIVIYIFRRHALSKEKLQKLSSSGEVAAEASKDYQDLCRQRMQSKTSDRPEPVHVAATRAGEPRSTHSSRSSTSSWSEEPAVTNMDISTGHIVLSYMEDHLKNKDRLDEEWEGLMAYEAEPNSVAMAIEPANMRKNRYTDVLPYDHSRVALSREANVSGSDYINASTITDHDPRNPAYIATQGPLPHTVADFWQMVWEQGSVVIVNLTKQTEGGNAMCHRYWPEEGSDLYHIYEVHLVSEHIWCDDYLVRSFYLKNLQTNETRTVTQFHFLSWPDLAIPNSIKALLDFRRKVNKSYRGRSCPIVVHCSDGSGRTGTYTLIDMVLNRMSKGAKEIDIAATLEHIRDQRMQMVKTKHQFEFALASVAEEVTAILKALPQQ